MSEILSKIFETFVNKYDSYVKEMDECGHSYTISNPNPYHMEGSVWTHTCCAYTHIKNVLLLNYVHLSEDELVIVGLSVLLHDIGKPRTRSELSNGNLTFKGHDFRSAQMIIDIAPSLAKDYSLSFDSILKIVRLVQCHTVYYQLKNIQDIFGWLNYDHDLLKLYQVLTKCDSLGQIRQNPDQVTKLDLFNVSFRVPFCEPEKQRKIFIVTGCPASGKDYVLNRLVRGIQVFSFDDIRVELYLEEFPECGSLPYDELYNKAWNWCNETNRNLFNVLTKKVKDAFAKGDVNVAISNTCLTKKSRKSMISLGRQYDADVECIAVVVKLSDLIKRDITRSTTDEKGKTVGEDVITRMFYSYNLPTKIEGFKTVRYVYNGEC